MTSEQIPQHARQITKNERNVFIEVIRGFLAESKEAIAGYIFLQVDDLNQAVEIAKECPGLEYDRSVEVRAADQQMGRAPA